MTINLHNTLYEDTLPTIENSSVALALCDLPYNTTAAKWEEEIDLKTLFKELWRILKPDGVVVFFAAFPFSEKVYNADPKHFCYKWYWHKTTPTGFQIAKYQPLRDVEEILVFRKKAGRYYPQGVIPCHEVDRGEKCGKLLKRGTLNNSHIKTQKNYPRSLLKYQKKRNDINPTAKPVDLLEYLIKTYTEPGEIVLDPTFGSGSTGVACVHTGRSFIGCEIDREQYDRATQRIIEAKGGIENDGEK